MSRLVERVHQAQALRYDVERGVSKRRVAKASGWWTLQDFEKTSAVNSVVDAYPSVVRFIGHVELKGSHPRTAEAYRMVLDCHRRYSSQSIRQGRAALTAPPDNTPPTRRTGPTDSCQPP